MQQQLTRLLQTQQDSMNVPLPQLTVSALYSTPIIHEERHLQARNLPSICQLTEHTSITLAVAGAFSLSRPVSHYAKDVSFTTCCRETQLLAGNQTYLTDTLTHTQCCVLHWQPKWSLWTQTQTSPYLKAAAFLAPPHQQHAADHNCIYK